MDVHSRPFDEPEMSEHSVKEQMRHALGPEVTAHVAALTAMIQATVPAVNELLDRVKFLEHETRRIEDALSASIAELAQRTDTR